MFLQLSAKPDLSSILPGGPVISQDKVGVAAVQNRQLAEWVGHGLIGSGHLKKTDVTGPIRGRGSKSHL